MPSFLKLFNKVAIGCRKWRLLISVTIHNVISQMKKVDWIMGDGRPLVP